MKNRKIIPICLTFLIFAIFLVVNAKGVSIAIVDAINNCLNIIIPSLFGFMILSSLIIESGIYKILFAPLSYLFARFFRLSPKNFVIFLLSLVGGYPVGAKLIDNEIALNISYHAVYEKMLLFCYCGSPAFIVSIVGVTLYGSVEVGLLVYLSNVTACIIAAIVVTRKNIGYKAKTCKNDFKVSLNSNMLINSILATAKALFTICVIILFFSIINEFISYALFSDSFMLNFGDNMPAILKSIVEISNFIGIEKNNLMLLPIISFITSFGGICSIFQVKSIFKHKFPLKQFLITRFLCASASAIITFAVTKLFDFDTSVSVMTNVSFNNNVNPVASILVMAMSLLLIFTINLAKDEK